MQDGGSMYIEKIRIRALFWLQVAWYFRLAIVDGSTGGHLVWRCAVFTASFKDNLEQLSSSHGGIIPPPSSPHSSLITTH